MRSIRDIHRDIRTKVGVLRTQSGHLYGNRHIMENTTALRLLPVILLHSARVSIPAIAAASRFQAWVETIDTMAPPGCRYNRLGRDRPVGKRHRDRQSAHEILLRQNLSLE
jgi:hypothetical protein